MVRLSDEKRVYFHVEMEMHRKDFQKSFHTGYIMTWHPILCVAQGLMFVNTVL